MFYGADSKAHRMAVTETVSVIWALHSKRLNLIQEVFGVRFHLFKKIQDHNAIQPKIVCDSALKTASIGSHFTNLKNP